MEISANNLVELKRKVIAAISNNRLEEESDIILDELILINQLGLITTESQPHTVKDIGLYLWTQRAFLVGFFPNKLMFNFVNKLTKINPDILVSETILNPDGDELVLWNFEQMDYDFAVKGRYPLHMKTSYNGNIENLEGFTANIKRPSLRDDYMENYSDFLLEQLYSNHYSLIEIYSRNINDNLFDDIIEVLKIL